MKRVPKRWACWRIRVISSGPMMPSGKPGKFSTSVVSINCPPAWKPATTRGSRPARAAYSAAVRPAGPEPMMTTFSTAATIHTSLACVKILPHVPRRPEPAPAFGLQAADQGVGVPQPFLEGRPSAVEADVVEGVAPPPGVARSGQVGQAVVQALVPGAAVVGGQPHLLGAEVVQQVGVLQDLRLHRRRQVTLVVEIACLGHLPADLPAEMAGQARLGPAGGQVGMVGAGRVGA